MRRPLSTPQHGSSIPSNALTNTTEDGFDAGESIRSEGDTRTSIDLAAATKVGFACRGVERGTLPLHTLRKLSLNPGAALWLQVRHSSELNAVLTSSTSFLDLVLSLRTALQNHGSTSGIPTSVSLPSSSASSTLSTLQPSLSLLTFSHLDADPLAAPFTPSRQRRSPG